MVEKKECVVGRFRLWLSGAEDAIPGETKKVLEDCLGKCSTSSLIVRLDMAPWSGEGTPPIYEVEEAPGGLFLFHLFEALFGKGDKVRRVIEKIAPLAQADYCSYPEWIPVHQILCKRMGWDLVTDPREAVKYTRVYFTGSPEDLGDDPELIRLLRDRLITDPWTTKEKVLALTGGRTLNGRDTFLGLLGEFPDGFVIKPVGGWGSKDIYIYPDTANRAFKGHQGVSTRTRIDTVLASISYGQKWMVQPFFPPKGEEKNGPWTIWRVYAIRYTRQEQFRVLGGVWNTRPNLKVHGASDAAFGPLLVQ